MIGICHENKHWCLHAKLFIPCISTYKNATTWVLSMNFHQRHASSGLTGWPNTIIRSCCVLSAFIINKSKTMESKCCKRFATTEAEIEEKRLKLNAERTIKQQKMAKILHTIIYTVTVSCVQCDILCKISELGY